VSAEAGFKQVKLPRTRENLVRKAFRAALAVTGYAGPGGTASVLLTDDEGISRIHEQHLGDSGATDVISFGPETAVDVPPVRGSSVPRVFGDIVVSLERASQQAEQYGHGEDEELALLVIHGVLHILGYDDGTPRERDEMRRMEQQAMSLVSGDISR